MRNHYDVIIAGLGAMGGAAAYHLAVGGARVLGLDRFAPPHDLGSSHGRSRIIREAYFEHPLYVPMVQRAYELWQELEKQSGRQLLRSTGGVMVGPRDGTLVRGAQRSAREHHLQHELLSACELQRRFPVFNPPQHFVAVWEPRAGVLFPELAIQTHLELAAARGAELRCKEPVLGWSAGSDSVTVTTPLQSYTARHLLLSAGAWTTQLLPDLALPLNVERQVLFWFQPVSLPEAFQPEKCPIYIWEYEPGHFFYGFPDLGDGVKIAVHHEGQPSGPDGILREVTPEDTDAVRQVVHRFLPAADGPVSSTAVCMYTNTPDEHFLLDFHPIHRQVLIVSPCSGHGFKFSPVIGEIAAAMLTGRPVPFDLSLFSIRRFVSKL
jgi:sarcosine oxidase